MNNALRYLFGSFLLANAAQAAPAVQTHDAIRDAVRAHLQAAVDRQGLSNTQISVHRLDRRLRLRRCQQDLETFTPHRQASLGRVTVGVRCHGPKPWTLYVGAQVRAHADVLVAQRAVPRGHVLQDNDVRLASRDVSALPAGYLTTTAAAVGKAVRRPLAPGTPILTRQLAAPKLVRRGQRVTLLIESRGVHIRANGTALNDGALGERVRVKNLRSQRVVEGIASATGTVRIH